MRPAGGVDRVAMPADRVGVRAREQEHPVNPLHRGHQRALVGQVAGEGPGRRWQAAGGLAGADQDPDLLSLGQQLCDQRSADLAAATDDKNHDFLRDGPVA